MCGAIHQEFESLTLRKKSEFKKPIEITGVEEHERIIDRQLLRAQLIFIENELQKSGNKDGNFLDIFKEYTDIIKMLSERAIRFDENNPLLSGHELDKARELFLTDLYRQIEEIAKNSSGEERIEKVLEFVELESAKIPDINSVQNKKRRVGLINFNQNEGVHFPKESGFMEDDDLLEIHFDSAFKNEGKAGLQEIKKWLSELAVLIVEKYPESKAVVGTSWLFDHPIMKRLGFITIEGKPRGYNWNQLIDKGGQIDVERLEQALITGKLPFRNLSGYILIEDFLNKYLPADKRGKIILKEVSREDSTLLEKGRMEIGNLRDQWKTILSDSLGIDYVLGKIPEFMIRVKSLGLEKEIIDFFETCLREKITFEEMGGNKELMDRFGPIIRKIDTEATTKKYKDRVVFIA